MTRNPRPRSKAVLLLNRELSRIELAIACQMSDDERLHTLAHYLLDKSPEIGKMRVDTLCTKLNISYKRVIEAYRDKMRLDGVIRIAKQFPDVAEGIAIAALPKDVPCHTCGGEGLVTQEGKRKRKCLTCEGKGQVRQPGDPSSVKHILEVMELIGKGALTVNAPGANVVVTGESLEDTIRKAREQRGVVVTNVLAGDTSGFERDQSVVGQDRTSSGDEIVLGTEQADGASAREGNGP